jgi:hypothetical protein
VWISTLDSRTGIQQPVLYSVGTTRIRADLINMTQIQTKTSNHQISEMIAIAAMTLLLIHIADGSME